MAGAIAVGGSACSAADPLQTRTRADFCYWFDRYLRTIDSDGTSTQEEVDKATRDLIAAGEAFGVNGNAPGIQTEVEIFALALDVNDSVAIDDFINDTLGYCEEYLRQEG